jgi:hypothetical protein
MEREAEINGTFTNERRAETRRVCTNWNKWYADPNNYFDPSKPDAFQDDSGI